jgi:hypothetical protein
MEFGFQRPTAGPGAVPNLLPWFIDYRLNQGWPTQILYVSGPHSKKNSKNLDFFKNVLIRV